jgi:hypothetical protein
MSASFKSKYPVLTCTKPGFVLCCFTLCCLHKPQRLHQYLARPDVVAALDQKQQQQQQQQEGDQGITNDSSAQSTNARDNALLGTGDGSETASDDSDDKQRLELGRKETDSKPAA